MFTTRHDDGHLHSRPMTTQNRGLEADESLWFFMSKKGDPVDELKADPIVNLVYADSARTPTSRSPARGDDRGRREEGAALEQARAAWFPGGPADPDLALVQVRIAHAHYWDVKESKLVQLSAMAKAAVTGKPPVDLGEHGEVRMRTEPAICAGTPALFGHRVAGERR
jgi:general stress protein 26